MNTSAGRKVIRIKAVMKLNWLVMFDASPLLTSIDRAVIHLFAARAQLQTHACKEDTILQFAILDLVNAMEADSVFAKSYGGS